MLKLSWNVGVVLRVGTGPQVVDRLVIRVGQGVPHLAAGGHDENALH